MHHRDVRRTGIVDHVWMRVADLAASKAFYMGIAPAAGYRVNKECPAGWRSSATAPMAETSRSCRGRRTENAHLAFPADRAHGPLTDPDGNTVELVPVTVFAGFETRTLDTDRGPIHARVGGSGPPLLCLHGFPQTHLMWHAAAPRLAERHTVVCADLPGYGDSFRPAPTEDHAAHGKRAMAADLVQAMAALGHDSVRGRRATTAARRVAYRMALDHPDRVERLAVMDIVPTGEIWARADATFALGYWHWGFLAQPAPLPEELIGAAPDVFFDTAVDAHGHCGPAPSSYPDEVVAAYRRQPARPGDGARRCARTTAPARPSTAGSTTRATAGGSPARTLVLWGAPRRAARVLRRRAGHLARLVPTTSAAARWRASHFRGRGPPGRGGRGAAGLPGRLGSTGGSSTVTPSRSDTRPASRCARCGSSAITGSVTIGGAICSPSRNWSRAGSNAWPEGRMFHACPSGVRLPWRSRTVRDHDVAAVDGADHERRNAALAERRVVLAPAERVVAGVARPAGSGGPPRSRPGWGGDQSLRPG